MRRTALLVGLTLLLAGCSGTPAPQATGGAWTFTDDVGTTVTLDERPDRVAGLNDVLLSLWNYDIEPVAAFGLRGISQDPRFADRDLSDVTELGAGYGVIDLEALAAAAPDVIVTHAYPADDSGVLDPATPLYGFADLAQQEAAARIAPIIALRMDGSAVQVVDRTVQLALALGADPSAVDAGRTQYAAAADRLRSAAATGLDVLVLAAYPSEGLYVAKFDDDPSLTAYADLGVSFVRPGGDMYYWEIVSWENAGRYPADVVLESQLDDMTPQELATQPTFASTAASRAGQIYRWGASSMDHIGQAAYMDELAGYLEGARKVT